MAWCMPERVVDHGENGIERLRAISQRCGDSSLVFTHDVCGSLLGLMHECRAFTHPVALVPEYIFDRALTCVDILLARTKHRIDVRELCFHVRTL